MSSKIFKIFCFCLCSFGILISSGNVLAAACGSATQQSWPVAPTANLCSSGTLMGGVSFDSGLQKWTWLCAGGSPSLVSCSAPYVYEPTPACGASNGVASYTTPTALCSAGNPSSVTEGGIKVRSSGGSYGTIFNWTCSNGNGSVNCSAPKKVNATCAANVLTSSSRCNIPMGYYNNECLENVCFAGIQTTNTSFTTNLTCPSGSDSCGFSVNCDGYNGGTGISCDLLMTPNSDNSSKIIWLLGTQNGSCGTSNGGTFSSAPTSNLCSTGNASGVITNSTTYTWTCYGISSGSTAYCSANRIVSVVNGSCGSSNGGTFSSAPTTNLCNAGTASGVTTNSTTYTWTCAGSGGGTNANCSANRTVNGSCGSSNGQSFYIPPTTNLCNAGNASSVTTNSTQFTWTCSGINGGSTVSCSSNQLTRSRPCLKYGDINQSGAINYYDLILAFEQLETLALDLIDVNGSSSADFNDIIDIQDYVNGTISTFSVCSKIVNGSCGTANGKTYLYSASSYGSDTQCAAGTSTNTAFPAAGGSVSWVCNGAYGGTNSGTCSASRYSSAPVNGACGTANGHGYYATSEIDTAAEQCSAGTFTSFTDNGSSWSWACNGINGGTNANCSANKVVCGSSHNMTYRDQPSSNLCSYGTNTSLTLTSNVWYWSCTNNPGVNAACYAYKTTCGSSNGGTFSSAPTTNLCIYGTASSVTTGDTTFTWTCTGNDSLAVSCSANRTLNASCGSSNGGNFSSAPTTNLCSIGNASSVTTNSTTYTWTCTGLGGGANANCSANRIANGACGTANGHGYYATSEIDTAAEQCSAGTFTSFTDNGSSWSWACNGSNGGTNASCSANKVVCGSVYNTTRKDQPSSNLCSYGTNTSLTLISNIWYWSCTNNPGMDAACYTYKTTCGSSNDSTFSSAPTTNLCAYGTASSVTTGDTTFTWTCTGNDSLAVSCSANRTLNGTCGTANGKTYPYSASGYGSDTQCAVGTPSNTSFPAAGATTTWTCSGVNGGSTSGTCSASRSSAPVNGTCGTANGQVYSASPSSNLCSVGTPGSVTTNTLTYTWTCTGSGGGTTANCSADRITFKNPSEIDSIDFGNTDGSCFYCEHYYDSNGVLRTGSLDVATKTANPKLRFTIDNTKYTQYKIKVGTVETATWTPITGSTVTYTGLKVGEGVSSDSASGTTLTITYGNGTAPKSYNWSINLKKTDNTETGWLSAGTFTTPAKPYPIVRLNPVAQSAYSSIVKYCSTTDSLTKSADTSGCFDTCWKGTGTTADLSSSDWKCSVCFNTSGQRTLCSTSNTTFTWKLPTAEIGTYQNLTNSNSPNPLFSYKFSAGSFKPGLRIAGSECAAEGETTGVQKPLPTWLEGR